MRNYQEFSPPPGLERPIEAVWASRQSEMSAHRVLPDGCLDLLFEVTGQGCRRELTSIRVVGPMLAARVVNQEPGQTFLGIRFRPGAAAAFLNARPGEMRDLVIDSRDVWRPDSRVLDELLRRPGVATLMQLLPRLFPTGSAIRQPLAEATVVGLESAPELPIDRIARRLGTSRQYLARVFRAETGLSPREFRRVLRFRRVIDHLVGEVTPAWADLAARTGYYDQSHLISEFRRLAGLSPTAYLRERGGFGG